MKFLFAHRMTYITLVLLIIGFVGYMIHGVTNKNTTPLVTATVESGTVQQLVSVSGVTEAKQTAELAFPTTGIVRDVVVETGDIVAAGDVLVTLDPRSLQADRQEAMAAIARAVASRDELLTGPTDSARSVTANTLTQAKKTLATTKITEAQKVANSYRTLLSTDLTAYSTDPTEDATAPTVTGTYTCDEEGAYQLSVYSSSANSGYSYTLSGLETGTYTAATEQPSPIGTCGLYIQFAADSESYRNSNWVIDVPNTRASTYTTNLNAYRLAITQADSAIALAEQAVTLAAATAADQNAPARQEAITKANATISEAQARLARIDAAIADRTLRAPFAGTITTIDILPGETVTTLPVVTLLASSQFTITAKVPEIDISKVATGQPVNMVFDAAPDEYILGTVTFISPQATEIDGVAYYETTIIFTDTPPWIRSGLNADIEIITSEVHDVLRIPKRFLSTETDGYTVRLQTGTTIATTTVELLLTGNDGFVAITGLNLGDTVVAP